VRLLLDTHIAVWAVLATERLSPDTLAAISDPDNAVAVSIASLWEIAVKNNLRRATAEPFGINVAQALAEFQAADFEIVAIHPAALDVVETLPRLHGDPFDRFLVASAVAGDWQFVTRDRRLTDYGSNIVLV
jgi:PIN domain nuclease of toxin-antitoxin system